MQYAAFNKFVTLIHSDEFETSMDMTDGKFMTMHNRRVAAKTNHIYNIYTYIHIFTIAIDAAKTRMYIASQIVCFHIYTLLPWMHVIYHGMWYVHVCAGNRASTTCTVVGGTITKEAF
jgi:hypothetical protein